MSNPTAEQYLQPDYDSNALKVAQLRGILLENGIALSSAAKKGELVQAFEDKVKAKASELLGAATRIRPSNKGFITVSEDGDESPANDASIKRPRGRPRKIAPDPVEVEDVTEPPSKKPKGRSNKESDNVEVEILASPPRKRGRPKRSTAKVDDDAGDEAEIEDDTTPMPQSMRSRSSLATESPISVPSAPSSTRHRSVKPSSSSIASDVQKPSDGRQHQARTSAKKDREPIIEVMDELKEESEKEEEVLRKTSNVKTPRRSAGEDSGFSDYNPFQSGSEEAAERERRRRKSSLGVQRSKPAQPRFSEPAPSAPQSAGLRRVGPSREDLKTPPKAVKDAMKSGRDAGAEHRQSRQAQQPQTTSNEIEEEPQISVTTHVQHNTSLVKRVNDLLPAVSTSRSVIPLSALFLLLLSFLANFKSNSASLGYCDFSSRTNDIVLNRQKALDNANACIARRTQLDLDNPGYGKAIDCDVSALPLVPFLPVPTSCAICPPHAICEDGQIIACEPEYLLSPHPLSILSPLADGLPGLGPRVFPPSCQPDTAKKRMIGGLAKEMERDLARGRGLVVCAGIGKEDGRKGVGERFGMEEHTLKEHFSVRRDPKFSQQQFDEIFESALKDLVEHEDVIESIDVKGRSWYAAARTEMTVGCRAKLEAVDLLERWKSQLGSTAAVLAAITFLRSHVKSSKEEKYKAEQLVQVVLKRLQDQEHLHYSDPVTTPNPFIPPTQIRDVVMPLSGSTASRTRSWQRVQDLVEANANVAVREREVRGEMWKTWEWQGVGERRVTWG